MNSSATTPSGARFITYSKTTLGWSTFDACRLTVYSRAASGLMVKCVGVGIAVVMDILTGDNIRTFEDDKKLKGLEQKLAAA